ncbi:uncharacterized protein LOC107430445 [Ziziphus jujuba]|uniref:Uncharacterized protein LOC107430445 n=1 Tax=Ziziphus jujuba TaxID=326968 RepID=A0A6P4AHG3_ZIZJJ|nr:uncharacterized protein LOC107430445 [Ziziphus jujuba]XP_048319685.2 uncharacterized protein LOC107430445 [Ziziphus jujuba]XP_060674369.1 uncharacterized protein LOC107430445 [Ziziphus jujuba]
MSSLKEYLKRYESNNEEEKKKKKKKKQKTKPEALGVLVVDEDPVWQKPVNLEEEEEENDKDEEVPQVDEDIEVKRMRRLEELRARRPYNAISEDGSGWVSLSMKDSNLNNSNSDMSPPRKRMARNDTPSPERELKPSGSNGKNTDLSPSRQRRRRHHTPSPETDTGPSGSTGPSSHLFPPHKLRAQNDEPSRGSRLESMDLSPPRQRVRRHHTPSPEPDTKAAHPSGLDPDISPPRRPRHVTDVPDISPPRRGRRGSPYQDDLHASPGQDLSPPRKSRRDVERLGSTDLSSPHSQRRVSSVSDLSPPRKNRKEVSVPKATKEERKTGLISGKDIREEIAKSKKEDFKRLQEMDLSMSGRDAEPVYRDKIKGVRITKEEFLKSQRKVEEKPKEKKLEWGKGLAQKREAEARMQELELEKDKPFARSRDDPELDKMLKERVRWGDPMAHLVKPKKYEPVLPNLGDDEKMKDSGFMIPQDIPNHSWLKRGLDAAPNRYGIRPGRHWDGVDRSNGYEKELFKRTNEKQATEQEAYLWSVADM